MKRLFVIAVLLLSASVATAQTPAANAWEQEPATYRGMPWEASSRDWIAKFKMPYNKVGFFDHVDAGANRIDPLQKRDGQWHCEERKVKKAVVGRTCGSLPERPDIPTVPATETLRFDINAAVEMLRRVEWEFEADQASTIRALLLGKYGAPHQTATSQLKNLEGATFDSETLTWEGQHVRLTFVDLSAVGMRNLGTTRYPNMVKYQTGRVAFEYFDDLLATKKLEREAFEKQKEAF